MAEIGETTTETLRGETPGNEPALLDRYVSAAARIARQAVGDPTIPPAFERYGAIKDNSNEQTYLWQKERLGEEFPLGSRGGIAARNTECPSVRSEGHSGSEAVRWSQEWA